MEPETQPQQRTRKRATYRRYTPLILIGMVIVLGVSTTFFYRRSVALKNPNAVSDAESRALIARVAKLALVPSDETPTIATVSDPEKLKDQSFFVDAKKGDKVLVYSNAKKAVLYDPVANKIINIAPINTGATPTTTPTVPTTPTKK